MKKREALVVASGLAIALGASIFWGMQLRSSGEGDVTEVGGLSLWPGEALMENQAATEEDYADATKETVVLEKPLTLTGVASTNEVFSGSQFQVKLDEVSSQRVLGTIPQPHSPSTGERMLFPAEVFGRELPIGESVDVRFTISTYIVDRRRIETFDSGEVLRFEEIGD